MSRKQKKVCLLYVRGGSSYLSGARYILRSIAQNLEEHNVAIEHIPLNIVPASFLEEMPAPEGTILTSILHKTFVSQDQANAVAQWSTTFLNDPQSWDLTHNKLRMYQHLKSCGFVVPHTLSAPTSQFITMAQAEEIFDTIGTQLVCKPAYGEYGRSTYLVATPLELLEKITETQAMYGINEPIVVQQYIDNYNDITLRVIYCRNHYMGCYARLVSPSEEKKFNNDNEVKYRIPIKVPNDLEQYMHEAMRVLGVDAACCDVLITDNGYMLVDVNTPGSFEVHDGICSESFGRHIAARMIEKMDLAGR